VPDATSAPIKTLKEISNYLSLVYDGSGAFQEAVTQNI
jgi:hypothetical protein